MRQIKFMHMVIVFLPHVSRHGAFNPGTPTASSQAVAKRESERERSMTKLDLTVFSRA